MTLNEFIAHLETIGASHGGDIRVEAKDECGELTELEGNVVYTLNPAMTGNKLIIDA